MKRDGDAAAVLDIFADDRRARVVRALADAPERTLDRRAVARNGFSTSRP